MNKPELYLQSPEKSPEAGLPVRISDALLPETKVWYDLLQPDLQDAYEQELHTIDRMGALREKLRTVAATDMSISHMPETIPPGTETNLHHVYETEALAAGVAKGYPALAEHINFVDVQKIILGHDVGEIGVDDQPALKADMTPEQRRRKNLEPWFGRNILEKIPDPTLREEALTFYSRYQEKNPRDMEVQMAQFLDKAQGTTSIAHASRGFLRDPQKSEIVHNHLVQTLPNMLSSYGNLLVYLPTEEARESIKQIMDSVISQIEAFGHTEAAANFNKLRAA